MTENSAEYESEDLREKVIEVAQMAKDYEKAARDRGEEVNAANYRNIQTALENAYEQSFPEYDPKCWNCKSRKDSVSRVMVDRPDGGLSESFLCDDCKELAGVPGYA